MIKKKNEIPSIIQCGEYHYEKYNSTIFKPFKVCYEEMTFLKKIRFLVQALRGSVIFYLKKEDNVLGYVMFEKGAGIRYPDTNENDVIISPYTVNPAQRGKGYGTRILIDVKESLSKYFKGNIYAEVRQNNIASIKAMEKAGYEFQYYAKQKGILKRYVRSDKESEYLVYKV